MSVQSDLSQKKHTQLSEERRSQVPRQMPPMAPVSNALRQRQAMEAAAKQVAAAQGGNQIKKFASNKFLAKAKANQGQQQQTKLQVVKMQSNQQALNVQYATLLAQQQARQRLQVHDMNAQDSVDYTSKHMMMAQSMHQDEINQVQSFKDLSQGENNRPDKQNGEDEPQAQRRKKLFTRDKVKDKQYGDLQASNPRKKTFNRTQNLIGVSTQQLEPSDDSLGQAIAVNHEQYNQMTAMHNQHMQGKVNFVLRRPANDDEGSVGKQFSQQQPMLIKSIKKKSGKATIKNLVSSRDRLSSQHRDNDTINLELKQGDFAMNDASISLANQKARDRSDDQIHHHAVSYQNANMMQAQKGLNLANFKNHLNVTQQAQFLPPNTIGSSSATNKIKKSFDFDMDQLRRMKRDKKLAFASQLSTDNYVAGQQAALSSIAKAQLMQQAQTQKKAASLSRRQKVGIVAQGKKVASSKPTKLKTQMNLTGPLPKHMLSPATMTSQNKGKSKHSHYFEGPNQQEILQINRLKHQQMNQNFQQVPPQIMNDQNAMYGQGYMIGQQAAPMPGQGQQQGVQPHRLQVHVRDMSTNATTAAQPHQFTTQGGSTVININIDPAAWNKSTDSIQQVQQVRNIPPHAPVMKPQHMTNQMLKDLQQFGSQASLMHQQQQYQSSHQQQMEQHMMHMQQQRHDMAHQQSPAPEEVKPVKMFDNNEVETRKIKIISNSKGTLPQKRLSSSKMNRNDSLSSNKSRGNSLLQVQLQQYNNSRAGNNSSYNRRSSSSSQMFFNQQDAFQQTGLAKKQFGQSQNMNKLTQNLNNQVKKIDNDFANIVSKIQEQPIRDYEKQMQKQQQYQQRNDDGQDALRISSENTQNNSHIIQQNIARINEKLQQQQLSQLRLNLAVSGQQQQNQHQMAAVAAETSGIEQHSQRSVRMGPNSANKSDADKKRGTDANMTQYKTQSMKKRKPIQVAQNATHPQQITLKKGTGAEDENNQFTFQGQIAPVVQQHYMSQVQSSQGGGVLPDHQYESRVDQMNQLPQAQTHDKVFQNQMIPMKQVMSSTQKAASGFLNELQKRNSSHNKMNMTQATPFFQIVKKASQRQLKENTKGSSNTSVQVPNKQKISIKQKVDGKQLSKLVITKTKINQLKNVDQQFASVNGNQGESRSITFNGDKSQNMIDSSVLQVGSARGDSSRGPKQAFAIAKYATTTDVQLLSHSKPQQQKVTQMIPEKAEGNHRGFVPQQHRIQLDADQTAQQSGFIDQSMVGDNQQRYILVNSGGMTYAAAQGTSTIEPVNHSHNQLQMAPVQNNFEYDQHLHDMEAQIMQDQQRLRKELEYMRQQQVVAGESTKLNENQRNILFDQNRMSNQQEAQKQQATAQFRSDDRIGGMQMDVDNEEISQQNQQAHQVNSFGSNMSQLDQDDDQNEIGSRQIPQIHEKNASRKRHSKFARNPNDVGQNSFEISANLNQQRYLSQQNTQKGGNMSPKSSQSPKAIQKFKLDQSQKQSQQKRQTSSQLRNSTTKNGATQSLGRHQHHNSSGGASVSKIVQVGPGRAAGGAASNSAGRQKIMVSYAANQAQKQLLLNDQQVQLMKLNQTVNKQDQTSEYVNGKAISRKVHKQKVNISSHNRSSAISFKGSSASNKSRGVNQRGRASRGSRQNRASNSKVNLEDINLEIESMMRQQFIMDSSLGLAEAAAGFGTKKSLTTKNQNSTKMHTQNVHNLLREAKREMLIDKELDSNHIFVGGEDIQMGIQTGGTMKNARKTQVFSFNSNADPKKNVRTQNLNNFSSVLQQQTRLNIQNGISPQNKQQQQPINFYHTSQNEVAQPQIVPSTGLVEQKFSGDSQQLNQVQMNNNANAQQPMNQNFTQQYQQYQFGTAQNKPDWSQGAVNGLQADKQMHQQQASTFGLGNIKSKIVGVGQQSEIHKLPATQAHQQQQMDLAQIKQDSTSGIANEATTYQSNDLVPVASSSDQVMVKFTPRQHKNMNQYTHLSSNDYDAELAIGSPSAAGLSHAAGDPAAGTGRQQTDTIQSLNIVNLSQNSEDYCDQADIDPAALSSQRQNNGGAPEAFVMNGNGDIGAARQSSQVLQQTDQHQPEQVPIQIEDQQNKQAQIQLQDHMDQPELPMRGRKVLKYFLRRPGLTEFEKFEVLNYDMCYFLGLGADKVHGSRQHPHNDGYDDERGDYNVRLKDQIAYRFEVLDFLGKGSFGQALKCFDHKTQEIVAIKIIRNKAKFKHQAGVELKILLHLRDNDPDDTNNIIRIKDHCVFRNHLIISFELFSINLYEFIKNNNFEGVSLSLIRRFAIQILQALKYLREENLIHCDLKPENILLKSPDKSGIKVIDFGSSCFTNEIIYTYIQSRFYRAPEIILGIRYTPAIDMWSFGCILTELFTGMPLFPGESEQEQLSLIMEVLGLPAEQILQQGERKQIFFNQDTGEPFLSTDSQGNLRIPGSKPLERILMCQSNSFIDFIKRCLEWDPTKRMTPFEALMHEWIIEGLPHQVLIHHKQMLGIQDSETCGDMSQSQSMANLEEDQQTPVQQFQYSQPAELMQHTQHMQQVNCDRPHLQLDEEEQQLKMQMMQSDFDGEEDQQAQFLSGLEIEDGQDYNNNAYQIDSPDMDVSGPPQAPRGTHGKAYGTLLGNQLKASQQVEDNNQIDFYGQQNQTEQECDYVDQMNQAHHQQQLMFAGQQQAVQLQMVDTDDSIEQHDASIAEINAQKSINHVITHKNVPSRSGAKQENFIKTGKQNFINGAGSSDDMNQENDQQQYKAVHGNMSDLTENEYYGQQQQMLVDNIQMRNQLNMFNQYMTGNSQNQVMPNITDSMKLKIPGRKLHKAGDLLDGVNAKQDVKSKTANVQNIIAEVNKRSKSLRNNVQLPQYVIRSDQKDQIHLTLRDGNELV